MTTTFRTTEKAQKMRSALRVEAGNLMHDNNLNAAICVRNFLDSASDESCARLFDLIMLPAKAEGR